MFVRLEKIITFNAILIIFYEFFIKLKLFTFRFFLLKFKHDRNKKLLYIGKVLKFFYTSEEFKQMLQTDDTLSKFPERYMEILGYQFVILN